MALSNGTYGVGEHRPETNGYANGNTNGHVNGSNGHANGNGYTNGHGSHVHEDHNGSANGGYTNGDSQATHSQTRDSPQDPAKSHSFEPIAICGMACRLPGGIDSPKGLWEFLLAGGDARSQVPKSRYNVDGFYSPEKRPGTIATAHGYFLDDSVDLAGLDASFFSMTRTELEWLDPQQRLMLEVARESLDDAGEVNWKGSNTGVYMGNFTQDWYDMMIRDGLRHCHYAATTTHDFMISERISHEMDLRGPR